MKGRPSRYSGRGGLGAVMGSKGLKFIVVNAKGTPGVEIVDKALFDEGRKKMTEALRTHAITKPKGGLNSYGTAVLINILNEAGGLPTRNFSSGHRLFIAFAILDIPTGYQGMVDEVNAVLGTQYTSADVVPLGAEILRKERAFNEAAGFGKAHDRAPEFMKIEPLPPHNGVFDVPDEALDAVYAKL